MNPCVHAHHCPECLDSLDHAALVTARKLEEVAKSGCETHFASADLQLMAETIRNLFMRAEIYRKALVGVEDRASRWWFDTGDIAYRSLVENVQASLKTGSHLTPPKI